MQPKLLFGGHGSKSLGW